MDTNTGQSWKKTCFETEKWCGGFKQHNNPMHAAKATLREVQSQECENRVKVQTSTQ